MNLYTNVLTHLNCVRCMPLAAISAAALLAGCADTPHADAAYGNSFRQTVQAQTFDPNAANNPATEALTTTDAERLKNALSIYRSDVAKGTSEVKQKVVFEVGSN